MKSQPKNVSFAKLFTALRRPQFYWFIFFYAHYEREGMDYCETFPIYGVAVEEGKLVLDLGGGRHIVLPHSQTCKFSVSKTTIDISDRGLPVLYLHGLYAHQIPPRCRPY